MRVRARASADASSVCGKRSPTEAADAQPACGADGFPVLLAGPHQEAPHRPLRQTPFGDPRTSALNQTALDAIRRLIAQVRTAAKLAEYLLTVAGEIGLRLSR